MIELKYPLCALQLAGFTALVAVTLPLSPVSAQDAALDRGCEERRDSLGLHLHRQLRSRRSFRTRLQRSIGIAIAYNDVGTNGAYNQVISEAAAGQVTADVVWSSAMDLQMTLVKDGYAQEYASPEAANIPAWANYKNILFGTTVEPIGVIYNTKALTEDRLPKTYADMITFLKDNKTELQGKVATFDPEKSGSGFLHHSNDARQRKDFWDFAKALGEDGAKIYSSSGGMKETVVSGENVIAINIIGSYALDWVKESPNLGVAFRKRLHTSIFALGTGRQQCAASECCQALCRFLLSQEGQSALAEGGLPAVRTDATGGLNIDTLNERVGGRPEAYRRRRRSARVHGADEARPVPERLEGRARTLMGLRIAARQRARAALLPRPSADSESHRYERSDSKSRPQRGRSGACAPLPCEDAGRRQRTPLSDCRHWSAGLGRANARWTDHLPELSDGPFFSPRAAFGLDAYSYVFTDRNFYKALGTTTVFAFGMVAIAVPLGRAARLPAHPHRHSLQAAARDPRARADVHLIDRARLRLHRLGRADRVPVACRARHHRLRSVEHLQPDGHHRDRRAEPRSARLSLRVVGNEKLAVRPRGGGAHQRRQHLAGVT